MKYPIKPRECVYCNGEMLIIFDDVDEVISLCKQCGSKRVWEDSPVAFADYWTEGSDN